MLLPINLVVAVVSQAQSDRFDALAKLPFEQNRPTAETASTLKEELVFQRATQTYLWALPLLNTMGMRDGFAESYSPTYTTMVIWTKRLDARTRVTTPNSDLIYGMVFVNLSDTGPLVFEAPPKLQGILLDMWQRPIPYDDGKFAGDLGLPGPDGGKGGKFLILPPGYQGEVPAGRYVCRSGTMKFEDASATGHEMLPRTDATAFKQLKYLVDTEGSNLADPDWLGMLAGLGIVEDKPFAPDAPTEKILSDAAMTAYKTSRGFDQLDERAAWF